MVKMARAAVKLSRAQEQTVADNAARYLAESLGELRGLPQKMGQILSMSASPERQPFRPLQEGPAPLDLAVVESVLEAEWGCPPKQILAELEPMGRGASLGQVHRGRLVSGETVAVKVQYPGIAQAVENDLRMMGWLMAPMGSRGKGFDIAGYRRVVTEDLQNELDYLTEADNQHQMAMLGGYLPGLIVPRVFGQHSTRQVLVTAWEDGVSLEEAAQWSKKDRNEAGRLLLRVVLETLFRHGLVQADLHPGNFRFRRGGALELVVYDFGCVWRPSKDTRLTLLRLIAQAAENPDGSSGSGDPYPLYVKLGFDPAYLEPMAHRLAPLTRVLFEPFLTPGGYPLAVWNLGERVGDILQDDRWNFRVAAPADLIFVMRVFHGLTHALNTLGAEVPWKFLLDPILLDFQGEMAALPLPVPEDPQRGYGAMARYLVAQVKEDGQVKVKITSPVQSLDGLKEMLDEDIMVKIRQQGTDIDVLIRQARQNGYRPQPIFHLTDGPKEVTVWLE
ncbi:MAG: AarF/ABC1/UbiB kinase family protein [Deltaproteobacteria bacterium]|nr:AarF/ABC1/UbiB kinase family protein [Deltaproteobacteria bacterium]